MPVITTACTRCSGMIEEGDRFCQDCGFRTDHVLRSPLLESPETDEPEQLHNRFSNRGKERSPVMPGGLPGFKAFGLRSSLRAPISVPEWLLVVAMTVYSGTSIYMMQKNHPNWFSSAISKISFWTPVPATVPAKPSAAKPSTAPSMHPGLSEVEKLFQQSKQHASTVTTPPPAARASKPPLDATASEQQVATPVLAPVRSPILAPVLTPLRSPVLAPVAVEPPRQSDSSATPVTPARSKDSLSKKSTTSQATHASTSIIDSASQPSGIERNSSSPTSSATKSPLAFTSETAKRHDSAPVGAGKSHTRHETRSNPVSSTSTSTQLAPKSVDSTPAAEEQPSETNWEFVPEAPVKKTKAKPITKKEASDFSEYNKQLAQFYSKPKSSTEASAKDDAGGTTGSAPGEPPSFDEWIKSNKSTF